MFDFFEIITNKNISIKLQLPQLIKIYNIFYANLSQKIFINPLINHINKFLPFVVINNKEK